MADVFSFKSFSVNQSGCAMKVCTDSCLLGAFAAKHMMSLSSNESLVLDIGTGTGLLSMMIAQKNPVKIHAVEIDPDAAAQAARNINESPFADQVSIRQSAIQEFSPESLYDFIITNPPFYEESLPSGDESRNTAMHSRRLTLSELLEIIKNFLSPSGTAYILLPFSRTGEAETLALRKGLHVHERVLIRHSGDHPFTRSILVLNHFSPANENEIEISIRSGNDYTDDFKDLLKDYYLYL